MTNEQRPENALAKADVWTGVEVGPHGYEFTSAAGAWKLAKMIVSAGLAPENLNTPERVFVVLGAGRELRIPPITALSCFYVPDGHRPKLFGDMPLVLVRRHPEFAGIVEGWGEDGTAFCKLSRRRGEKVESVERSFGMEDAEAQGLLGKANYQEGSRRGDGGKPRVTPGRKRMFQMRARRWAIADLFPDAVMAYAPDDDFDSEAPQEPREVEIEVGSGIGLDDLEATRGDEGVARDGERAGAGDEGQGASEPEPADAAGPADPAEAEGRAQEPQRTGTARAHATADMPTLVMEAANLLVDEGLSEDLDAVRQACMDAYASNRRLRVAGIMAEVRGSWERVTQEEPGPSAEDLERKRNEALRQVQSVAQTFGMNRRQLAASFLDIVGQPASKETPLELIEDYLHAADDGRLAKWMGREEARAAQLDHNRGAGR